MKILEKSKKFLTQKKEEIVKLGVFTTVATTATTTFALAGESSTELAFNFNPNEMFKWTNVMLQALMPVLYITLGISLAFIIINALKYAFR